MMKEVKIVGSLCYSARPARGRHRDRADILACHGELMRRADDHHRFPADRIDEGFKAANDKTSGSIKVSIAPA